MRYKPKWMVDLANERMRATIELLRDDEISIWDARRVAWELKKEGFWWQAMIIFKAIKKKKGGGGDNSVD